MLKENTIKLYKKIFLNTQWLVALSFFILLFSPKIDLFFIPYRQQGIRIEDFILLTFTLYFLVTNKIRLNPEMPGFNFVAFFPYFLFSFFIGQAAGLPIKWDMVLRFIEYVIFMIFIIENVKDKKFILTFIRFYIILNFIAASFQLVGVLGGITSVQYFEAGFLENNRPMGLLGGAWEGVVYCA